MSLYDDKLDCGKNLFVNGNNPLPTHRDVCSPSLLTVALPSLWLFIRLYLVKQPPPLR